MGDDSSVSMQVASADSEGLLLASAEGFNISAFARLQNSIVTNDRVLIGEFLGCVKDLKLQSECLQAMMRGVYFILEAEPLKILMKQVAGLAGQEMTKSFDSVGELRADQLVALRAKCVLQIFFGDSVKGSNPTATQARGLRERLLKKSFLAYLQAGASDPKGIQDSDAAEAEEWSKATVALNVVRLGLRMLLSEKVGVLSQCSDI